jgi:hypothetical protein
LYAGADGIQRCRRQTVRRNLRDRLAYWFVEQMGRLSGRNLWG